MRKDFVYYGHFTQFVIQIDCIDWLFLSLLWIQCITFTNWEELIQELSKRDFKYIFLKKQ